MDHVKLWTDRVLSLEFNMLSIEAQVVWLKCYALAGKCDADGLLLMNGRALELDDLFCARIPRRKLELCISELIHAGFLIEHRDKTLALPNFTRDQHTAEALRKKIRKGKSTWENSGELALDIAPITWENSGAVSQDVSQNGLSRAPSIYNTNLDPGSPGSGITSVLVDKSTRTSAALPIWMGKVRGKVREIADLELAKLGLDERIDLGKYAAFRWANCTLNENYNAKKARTFAAQIEAIGAKKRFSTLKVREFIGAGNRCFEATNKLPIHSLWAITAAVEDES